VSRSAGILIYRIRDGAPAVLLAHPGGPYWARKDRGAWSLPKGEIEPGEDALAAAQREVEEETGFRLLGPYLPLGEVVQRGGKRVVAWAVECDVDPAALRSGTFALEWPPKSGRLREFPEVDRAAWFGHAEARRRLLPSQAPFLDALVRVVG
jgi:predicted NUDIX family NTP pyrophosphohydrolase